MTYTWLGRCLSGKILSILPAWCTKRTTSLLFRFTRVVVVLADVPAWQNTGLFRDWRHSIEIVNGVTFVRELVCLCTIMFHLLLSWCKWKFSFISEHFDPSDSQTSFKKKNFQISILGLQTPTLLSWCSLKKKIKSVSFDFSEGLTD